MSSSSHYYSQYNKKYIDGGRKYVKEKSIKYLLDQFMVDINSEQGQCVLAILKEKNCLYDNRYIDKDLQIPPSFVPTCKICFTKGYKSWKLVGITTEEACRVIMYILPYIWCEKCFRKRFCYQDQNPITCGIAVFPPTDYTSDKFKDVGSHYINKQSIPPNLIHSPKSAPNNNPPLYILKNSSPPPVSKPGLPNSPPILNLRSSNSSPDHSHVPLLSNPGMVPRPSPHPLSPHPLLSSSVVARPPIQNAPQPAKNSLYISQSIPIINDPAHPVDDRDLLYQSIPVPHDNQRPPEQNSPSLQIVSSTPSFSVESPSLVASSNLSDGLHSSLSSELVLADGTPDGVVLDSSPVEETPAEQVDSNRLSYDNLPEESTFSLQCYHKGFFKNCIIKYPNESRNEKKRKEIFLYDATFKHSAVYSDNKHPFCVVVQPGPSSIIKKPFIMCLCTKENEDTFLTELESFARVARLNPPPTLVEFSQDDDSD